MTTANCHSVTTRLEDIIGRTPIPRSLMEENAPIGILRIGSEQQHTLTIQDFLNSKRSLYEFLTNPLYTPIEKLPPLRQAILIVQFRNQLNHIPDSQIVTKEGVRSSLTAANVNQALDRYANAADLEDHQAIKELVQQTIRGEIDYINWQLRSVDPARPDRHTIPESSNRATLNATKTNSWTKVVYAAKTDDPSNDTRQSFLAWRTFKQASFQNRCTEFTIFPNDPTSTAVPIRDVVHQSIGTRTSRLHPLLLSGSGHGAHNRFLEVAGTEPPILSSSPSDDLSNLVIHLLSCMTAYTLGRELVTSPNTSHRPIAFIGYSDNINLFDGVDDFDLSTVRVDTAIDNCLLDEGSFQEALDAFVTQFEIELNHLLTMPNVNGNLGRKVHSWAYGLKYLCLRLNPATSLSDRPFQSP